MLASVYISAIDAAGTFWAGSDGRAILALLEAFFSSVKQLISARKVQPTKVLFHWKSYLPTLGILPAMTLMIAEVYIWQYNYTTLQSWSAQIPTLLWW